MNVRKIVSYVCAAALLAGCSGSSPTLPAAGGGDVKSFHRHRATLTIHIRIPRRHRHHRRGARFVSGGTKGMTLHFNGPTKLTETVGLTPGTDSRCTGPGGGPYACTIGIQLLSGSYTGSISTYDNVSCSGSGCTIPGGANLLSTASNLPFTITPYIVNNIGFTLDGVASSLTVSGLPSGTVGTPFASPQTFTVTAKDADGYTIVGTYDNAVALGNSDGSGATAIATSGSDNPPANELLGSSDSVTLSYTGVALASATITASATGATSGNGTFTPATPSAPALTKLSIASIDGGASGVSVTLTGTNFTQVGTSVAASGSGMTFGSVTYNSSTSITANVTVGASAAFGPRNVTVTTPGGTTGTVPLTVYTSTPYTVNSFADSAPGTIPGTCPAGAGSGTTGDLRYAICNASAGALIQFVCASPPCKVTLAGPLPDINENLVVDGGTFGNVIIDGNSSYRAFYAQGGTVTLANLQIQNAKAKGGAGGSSSAGYPGGGGGAGLGGGLFVDAATVNVVNDYFFDDAVAGGSGGSSATGFTISGSGGGGMGGDGGQVVLNGGGGGAGGLIAAGGTSDGTTGNGGTGGQGFTSTGGTGGAGSTGGLHGTNGGVGATGGYGGGGGGGGYAGPACFCTGGQGGAGGFGGGGGGGGGSASGGAGGFGGGGGGSDGGTPGIGGPGGGGGSNSTATGSLGGNLSSTVAGGKGGFGSGGGGAAAGPAIFVNTGTVTTSNSGGSGLSATGGPAGSTAGPFAGGAGGSDATGVFNYGGTVNGLTVTAGSGGPVASALSGTQPQLRRAPHARHLKHSPR